MNCDDALELLLDRVSGSLEHEEGARLEAHLAACPRCAAAAEATTSMWSDLDSLDIEVPHDRLRARFHAALAVYEAHARHKRFEGLFSLLRPRRIAQAGVAIGLVAAGIAIGRWLPSTAIDSGTGLPSDIGAASLALLEHPSASERLRGVAWARRAASSDAVIAALISTVRDDPSVNVRLAAVEALSGRLDRPSVRSELTRALDVQQPPMMQVALAQILVAGHVDGSTSALRRLVEDQSLDPSVRDYLDAVLEASPEDSSSAERL